ncbi:MAG: hypothetical protein RL562_3396, partial [Planctomycetota bacterium]
RSIRFMQSRPRMGRGHAAVALCTGLAATAALGAQQVPWERNPTPLIDGFVNMYNPCVIEVDESPRYRMWFFGWAATHTNVDIPGCDAIYHARSDDLQTWEVYAGEDRFDSEGKPATWVPVLTAGDRWYEAWHVGDPSVVQVRGRFYMAYSATSRHFDPVEGYPSTMVQCVLGAVSEDGIHWEKGEHPLLFRDGDEAEPKPEPDRIGDFHRPSLLYENGRFRLWFDYWIPNRGVCTGHARSRRGFLDEGAFQITHPLDEPVLDNWPNPAVVKVGRRYHCFGDPPGFPVPEGGDGWQSRQIREAISEDGLTWEVLPFVPPDEDAEGCHVPQPLLTRRDGKTWLYLLYSTQVGTRRGDGVYHFEYDRIRAMRRRVTGQRGVR